MIEREKEENSEGFGEGWKEEIQKKIDERNIIAVESIGVLTSKDVLTAIDVMDELEADRDETEEWNHIRKLQHERAERLAEVSPN